MRTSHTLYALSRATIGAAQAVSALNNKAMAEAIIVGDANIAFIDFLSNQREERMALDVEELVVAEGWFRILYYTS